MTKIDDILNKIDWNEIHNAISFGKRYEISEDDSNDGKLIVSFNQADKDTYVSLIPSEERNKDILRFRTPAGGAISDRKRKILMLFALASEEDGKE